MKKINKDRSVLIIGAGNIGAFYDTPRSSIILSHAHAVTNHSTCNLVGFFDIDHKKAKQAAYIWDTAYFGSLEQAFSQTKPDIVIVATSDNSHSNVLLDLSKYQPLVVIVEKPIATSVVDGEKIIKLFAQKNIPLLINYSRRFIPVFQNLKNQIDKGIYGKFLGGTGIYGKGIIHNGSHLIDLLSFLVGESKVFSVFNRQFDYSDNDPSVSFILNVINDVKFTVHSINSKLYTIFECDLFFERKRIRILNSGNNVELYDVVSDKIYKNYKILGKPKIINVTLHKSLYYLLDNAYHISLNNRIKPLCSGEEAIHTLRICQSIRNLNLHD